VIPLDVADVVTIAGRLLDLDGDALFQHVDLVAAAAALAQAATADAADASGASEGRDAATSAEAAAASAVALMHALLVHQPCPRDRLRVAAVAGLQLLSVNGWRADLEPPETAAVVVEALAAGRLGPREVTAWFAPRLRPVMRVAAARGPLTAAAPRSARAAAHPRRERRLIGALAALALAGLALLAAACGTTAGSTAPGPAPHGGTGGQHVRIGQVSAPPTAARR
jgi:hypothetical protein